MQLDLYFDVSIRLSSTGVSSLPLDNVQSARLLSGPPLRCRVPPLAGSQTGPPFTLPAATSSDARTTRDVKVEHFVGSVVLFRQRRSMKDCCNYDDSTLTALVQRCNYPSAFEMTAVRH